MDAYIYQAALLCGKCGAEKCQELIGAGKGPQDPDHESLYDSDDFPKGPYADGGGESDSPQYCDYCEAFLENDLTDEGMDYVLEAVAEFCLDGSGREEIIREWIETYGIGLSDMLEHGAARAKKGE